jgi:SET domain-containing protein
MITKITDFINNVEHRTKFNRIGLYEYICLINHSCEPNAEYISIGDYTIIRTLRKIKKG